MNFRLMLLFVLLPVLNVQSILAQQLIYKPINPSFGGFYYNAQWLLASAQAQNIQTESYKTTAETKTSTLEEFKKSFNQQILYQLTRQFYNNAFGEEGLKEGHYELGDYVIDISNGSDGITINIYDPTTGSQTDIIIPYY